MASQIPSGILAERYGGKYIFGFGVLFTGLFNVITPIAARSSLASLYTVRVLTGLSEVWHQTLQYLLILMITVFFFQGVAFPVLQAMLAQWVPKSERTTIGAFVYAGYIFIKT